MILEYLEGENLICRQDVFFNGVKVFTKENRNIMLYSEDNDTKKIMLINELGKEHWFSFNQLIEYFSFEDKIAFNYQQPWIDEERQQTYKKRKVFYINKFGYKKEVSIGIGDFVEIINRPQLISITQVSYFGEVLVIEAECIWVMIEGKKERFAFSEIDVIFPFNN